MIVLKILGYLWALPHSLVGLLLALTWYFPKRIVISEGAIDVVIRRDNLIGGSWVGGQTYGWIIFYKDERNSKRPDLRAHERLHKDQALIGGPFFPLAYGLHFLWLWLVKRKKWQDAYRNIWFEKKAYELGAKVLAELPKAKVVSRGNMH